MKYDEIQNCLSKEACPFVQNAKICIFFFTNMVAGIIKLKSSNSQRQIAAKKVLICTRSNGTNGTAVHFAPIS
jgi:hypothetical protein